MAEKERKEKKSFRCVLTRPVIENSKKISKKHSYGSSKAKIRWEGLRKSENKKNRSDEFLPDPE